MAANTESETPNGSAWRSGRFSVRRDPKWDVGKNSYGRPGRRALAAESELEGEVKDAIRALSSREGSISGLIDYYRDEAQFEMGLIGTRTTWLITSQAFLVTGYVTAIAYAVNNDHPGEILIAGASLLVAVLGLFIAGLSNSVVSLCADTVDLWKRRLNWVYEVMREPAGHERADDDIWRAKILGRWIIPMYADKTSSVPSGFDPLHHDSMSFSALVPKFFLGFWSVLLVLSGTVMWEKSHLVVWPLPLVFEYSSLHVGNNSLSGALQTESQNHWDVLSVIPDGANGFTVIERRPKH